MQDVIDLWPWLLAATDLVLATWVTLHAVLRKRDVRAAIGWTGLVWLAPILGAIAYLCLGVNRIQRKAARLHLRHARSIGLGGEEGGHVCDEAAAAVPGNPDFAGLQQLGQRLSGKPLLAGNRIGHLLNGDQTYPAMAEAIGAAERSVGLLSYIFDDDSAGVMVLDALTEAQRNGAEVRVLIDGVGARYSKSSMVARLQDRGIRAATFLPSRLPWRATFANLRNHRKILVVDGRIGFTGGTNIREAHWLSLQPRSPTQCLHFRLEGPVVGHLQETFATDWAFATGEVLSGDRWFARQAAAGETWARGIAHGPDEDFETLSKVIFAGLSIARRRVAVVSPYFLPDARLIEALAVAALRGVDVRIYLPSDIDIPIVAWAAMAQMWQILEAGCRVFVTAPPFDHTKLMLVDDGWTLIGSTNWDPRSLRLNFEFNVECYDEGLARVLSAIVERKAAGARELRIDDVNGRSFPVRLRDGVARLLSPYL